MNEAIAQSLTRNYKLTVENLQTLPFQMRIENNQVILEHGFTGRKLKQPVILDLDKVLAAKELGLIKYVIEASLSYRSSLLPYVFNNESMLRMARYFLRHCSRSLKSFCVYASLVKKYTDWLGNPPDLLIKDLKPVGNIVDPQRLQNHIGFVNDYLAELQDNYSTSGYIVNHIKATKMFYRINGAKIELVAPLVSRISYKDRSPTSDELTRVLDVADLREKVIVCLLSLGGFREGTLSKLKYCHVKDDLEVNRVPVHVHVDAEITKGKYGDYDTFLGADAAYYLRLYLQQRRQGTRYTLPEVLTDDSPLIRNENKRQIAFVSSGQISSIVQKLYVKAGIVRHRDGHYDVRTHSLRKYFKTQLIALGVQSDYVDYFMGHVLDTYHDIQSVGIEKLRSVYGAAGLSIRSKAQVSKLDHLKEMIRAFGLNPDDVLSRSALADGAVSSRGVEDQQVVLLRAQLRELILKETSS